ncbi:hypothetical protein QC334_37660 [Streptomyces sp. DH18]|uniref:hypothetical protein n=1 Tax=Streptomyces sp. DH18 TaxID=3040126 RepID=UPI002441DF3B|nr:hypothetical protein [Streptomyces sp. DH18]MDG9688380.1 hypothetical protein [Streptomyces sp. DH18]
MFGFGRSSAITVSFTAIGWEAPEELASRAVEPISPKALEGEVAQGPPRGGGAAVLGEVVLAQVGQSTGAGSGAGLLPLGRRLLVGVPVVQVRCADPLDLIGRGDLQHSEDAQHVAAKTVRRSRRVRLPCHQLCSLVARDRPPARRRCAPGPAAEAPWNPMISSTTDNKEERRGL